MGANSITRFGLVATLILASYYSYGQNASSVRIKFPRHTIRLDSAMRIVRHQLGVEFTYNPQQVNVRTNVTFKNTRPTLTEFLETLTRSRLTTRVMDNHIVVTPSVTKPIEPVAKSKTEEKIILAKVELKKKTESPIASAPAEEKVVLIQPIQTQDNALTQIEPTQQLFNNPPPSTEPVVTKKETLVAQKNSPVQKTKKTRKSDTDLFTPFVKVGVIGNEIFYSNLHVQTGVPLLFGEISLATNYDINQLRYGIGTSINLGSRTRLITNFSTGKGSRLFTIRDSLEQSGMRVTEKLDKVNVGIEWQLRKNLMIDAGVSWNKLSCTYTMLDSASLPADYNTNFNNEFYIIKPPYTLRNEHSSKSGIKTWIGFYVGISYRINFSRKR
jgi:hypothetical protein